MQIQQEITHLVDAVNSEAKGGVIRLRNEDFSRLEAIVQAHPDIWPTGLVDALTLLDRKLRWGSVDRSAIPSPLLDFFDDTYKRDLDPIALARQIGQDIHAGCAECECKC